MFKYSTASIFLVIFAIAFGACSTPATTPATTGTNQVPPVTTISLSADIQPIFNASCVVCHQGNPAAGGMNLESGQAYGNIVNKKSSESALMRVTPGSPENSYLVRKLEGTHTQAGGSGDRMPPGSSLPAAQIELVRRWISLGAPNN